MKEFTIGDEEILRLSLAGYTLTYSSASQLEEVIATLLGQTIQLEAENERLRDAIIYARKKCYKHYDGDDACSCKIYNAALGGER